MRHTLALAALLALGCANDTSCPMIRGVFSYSFSERVGNCGPLDPVTVEHPGETMPAPGCTIVATGNPDACSAHVEQRCTHTEGSISIDGDTVFISESRLEGTWSITDRNHDGSIFCASTYDVVGTRIGL